jgi:hypothetical protein
MFAGEGVGGRRGNSLGNRPYPSRIPICTKLKTCLSVEFLRNVFLLLSLWPILVVDLNEERWYLALPF